VRTCLGPGVLLLSRSLRSKETAALNRMPFNSIKNTNSKRYNAVKNENIRGGDENLEFRKLASQQGKELLDAWLSRRKTSIEDNILRYFDDHGRYTQGLTATTFSDLYKWTMIPVIRYLEAQKPGGVKVTFGIDLRQRLMRDDIKENLELENLLVDSLKSLQSRKFNRNVFMRMYEGPRASIFSKEELNRLTHDVCVDEGAGRSLVDGKVHHFPKGTDDILKVRDAQMASDDPNKVNLYFYYNKDAVYGDDKERTETSGMHFIEAVGPWHKVTWLETSMMQCVYETKLRFDLEKQKVPYYNWLYGALLRCAKSVAYTRLVQNKYGGKPMPALFTGRRTGGFLFILLQNLFFADHFNQVGGLLGIPSDYPGDKTLALGTSSCDSWAFLTDRGLPCLNPSGTNAHELRMVTQILYPQIDTQYPLTQVLVDYLYLKLVKERIIGPAPMPMLPDTLGTRAYLKAATFITLDAEPFLKKITSARQDSGKLADFIANMSEFEYTGSKMASEIEYPKDLLEAVGLGYETFGAGGFFGDSEKVWTAYKDFEYSNSMAVKAVRVSYAADASPAGAPYIEFADGKVTGYPLKIGDPKNKGEKGLTGKLSIDKNRIDLMENILKYAISVREMAESEVMPDSTMDVTELLKKVNMRDPTSAIAKLQGLNTRWRLQSSVNSGGRRRSTRKVKARKARKTYRNVVTLF